MSDITDDIYAPDFVFQRKASTHTLRKRNYATPTEYMVNITRPLCDIGIPVTEMDDYVNDKSIFIPQSYNEFNNKISLGKKKMYEDFIFYIEEFCISKTEKYDIQNNMNKTIYKVPIIGYIKNESDRNYNYQTSMFKEKIQDEKFIMINHKMYSINKYYRAFGLNYTEVNIPENYFTNTKPDIGEHYYTSDKMSCLKDNITYSFHHEIKISSLIIKPENMSFKNVHGDNTYSQYERRNTSLMRKKKYFIKVLENDPGFITKFELQYRSDLTNGQWIKHGIYNGNVSIADSVKICFEEIQVKEIKIVPISFHKSFEKVQIKFIGKADVKISTDDIFVTYEISIPRDGKYLKYSSKVLEKKINYGDNLKIWRYGKKNRYNNNLIKDYVTEYYL